MDEYGHGHRYGSRRSSYRAEMASTIWRTVADQKNKVYFFDSATSPNSFWVPLADLDFAKGRPVKKLTVAGGKVYVGNVAKEFVPAEPFKFMTVDVK